MRRSRWRTALILSLTLGVLVNSAEAQGKGKGYGENKAQRAQGKGDEQQAQPAKGKAKSQPSQPQAQARDKAQSRGNAANAPVAKGRDEKLTGIDKARTRANVTSAIGGTVTHSSETSVARTRFIRPIVFTELRPSARKFVVSTRPPERILGVAVALAQLRGLPENAFVITPSTERVLVRNNKGTVLLDLDDDRASNLGSWIVVPVDNRVTEGAPSFCRSGAGHPVWGRQWCLDKGFGLGSEAGFRWGRKKDPGDIVFREVTTDRLATAALRNLIGDVVFNRLALHAITLGLADPLTGVWLGEPTGPRVLLLTSGNTPVAEIVDANRDNRVETLVVALRPW